MYDPTLGRFLEEDPIGIAGGDPNFYRYCGNDPLRFTDADGLKIVVQEGQAEYFVGLLNQLCPRGHFDYNPFTGSVEPEDPQFCGRKDSLYEGGCQPMAPLTPDSCECVCTAIKDTTRTFSLRREDPRFGDQFQSGTYGEKTDNPIIYVGQEPPNGLSGTGDECPPNHQQNRVRSPEWLNLGHELCGHAVPKLGKGSGAATIAIDNAIRQEHSEFGGLGWRDGTDHEK